MKKKQGINVKVVTPEFRVSYPYVFEPTNFEGQKPKYQVVMLFDKKTNISELKKAASTVLDSVFPDKATRPKGLHNPFRDGDTERQDKDGYAGCIFVKASTGTKFKPVVIKKVNGSNIQINENEFYAGCYAKASITCAYFDNNGKKGITFYLGNILKTRDGEPFSGRNSVEEDFKDEQDSLDSSIDDFGVDNNEDF